MGCMLASFLGSGINENQCHGAEPPSAVHSQLRALVSDTEIIDMALRPTISPSSLVYRPALFSEAEYRSRLIKPVWSDKARVRSPIRQEARSILDPLRNSHQTKIPSSQNLREAAQTKFIHFGALAAWTVRASTGA